jgi:hypothetical protein
MWTPTERDFRAIEGLLFLAVILIVGNFAIAAWVHPELIPQLMKRLGLI